MGRRDYAILMMLAKLGLRANEVATLTLDDIDWRASEILVRAKGRQRARMPIPPDIGAAIVAYLRNGRPKSSCRRLFVRTLAPHVGFASGCAITMIAKAALERVGNSRLRAPRRPYLPVQPRHRASPIWRDLVGDRTVAATREPRHHPDLCEGGRRCAPNIEPAVAGRRAMTDLRSALERYLSMRQGDKNDHQTRRLTDFVTFMEKRKATIITTKLAMEWATLLLDRHAPGRCD